MIYLDVHISRHSLGTNLFKNRFESYTIIKMNEEKIEKIIKYKRVIQIFSTDGFTILLNVKPCVSL